MFLDMLTTAPARHFHIISRQERALIRSLFDFDFFSFSPEAKDSDVHEGTPAVGDQ